MNTEKKTTKDHDTVSKLSSYMHFAGYNGIIADEFEYCLRYLWSYTFAVYKANSETEL